MDALQVAPEGRQVEVGLEDLLLGPARLEGLGGEGLVPLLAEERRGSPPRPRASSGSSRPASCIDRVEAPRLRSYHRLCHREPTKARQSTPECSKKRLSSAASKASLRAGEKLLRATHSSRRTGVDRRSASGVPSRASSTATDGRAAALTSAKAGMGWVACTVVAPRPSK
jgi:hypothetical protein